MGLIITTLLLRGAIDTNKNAVQFNYLDGIFISISEVK
ncbi:hypothetical protein yfred0001_11980 [Yersinia frederiksenii ATCC 33641]|nr:hypothetical protein yfred0001_11980 [Yersinia frederiksenii ATCC 33641]